MKATIATIVLSCSAEKLKTSRKVPPRHPLNRLARLQKFGFAFNEVHFSDSQKVSDTIENFTTNMKESFERDNCGFYDSEMKPHGGPDPSPEIRESGRARNGTSRRRRDAEGNDVNQWMFDACDCQNQADSDADVNACFAGLSVTQTEYYSDAILEKFMCEDDDESTEECDGLDEATCAYHGDNSVAVRGGKSNSKTNARLSKQPERAVKQITTGLRKWAERYLNNCHGMRKDEVPRRRAKNLYKKWLAKYEEEN